jgi:cell division septum initiation protein DivIVA
MDEQASKRFEQELKNDSALREDFTIMKGVREMLKRRECLEFIESVKQARENYYQEKEKAKQKLINRREKFSRFLKSCRKPDTN